MANINFDQLFYIDSGTLQPAESGIALPTYGNFGGVGYSHGVFVLDPDLAQFDPAPVDALDQLFQVHDQAYAVATATAEQSVADVELIRGIGALDQLDPEASLYGGAATLAIIMKLEENGSLGLLTQEELVGTTTEALQDIERGLAEFSWGEIYEAVDWMNDVADAPAFENADGSNSLGNDSPVLQGLMSDLLWI